MRWRTPFFDLPRELRDLTYRFAASATTHHRKVTLISKEDSRSTEITWATNPLPVSLLLTCRRIYHEAREAFVQELAERAKDPRPVRFIIPTTGFRLVLLDHGLITKIHNEVAQIASGNGVDGRYELMREHPRKFNPTDPLCQTLELDYLIVDCAEYISRVAKPNRPAFELCITYKDVVGETIAIEAMRSLIEGSEAYGAIKEQIYLGVFLKQSIQADGTSKAMSRDEYMSYASLSVTLWDYVKMLVRSLPRQQFGRCTLTILELREEEWMDKWADERPPTSRIVDAGALPWHD